MTRYKDTYRVETTRLPAYDYGSPGWYHVVICTKGRVCCFGEVIDGTLHLSPLGQLAHRFCVAIPEHFGHAVVDTFVVMPNHVHLLIGIRSRPEVGTSDEKGDHGNRRDARSRVSTIGTSSGGAPRPNRFGPLPRGALQTIVQAYKSTVTRWARRQGAADFAWQPRFWDRVIRTERELQNTRQYIVNNPTRWATDRLHP